MKCVLRRGFLKHYGILKNFSTAYVIPDIISAREWSRLVVKTFPMLKLIWCCELAILNHVYGNI